MNENRNLSIKAQEAQEEQDKIMNKPKRKAVITIITSYALYLASLIGLVASAFTFNIELAVACFSALMLTRFICFVASVIGMVILYKNHEGMCASVWIGTIIASIFVPVSPENIGLNLSMGVTICAFASTIWAIVKLWEIGGSLDA